MLIIHIGPHKTATTSVQAFLESNPSSFKYISRDTKFWKSCQMYMYSRISDEQLISEARRYSDGDYILSNENFAGLLGSIDFQRSIRLFRILASIQFVKVVYVSRPFSSLLPSIFNELYRAGDLHSFSEFIESSAVKSHCGLPLSSAGFVVFSEEILWKRALFLGLLELEIEVKILFSKDGMPCPDAVLTLLCSLAGFEIDTPKLERTRASSDIPIGYYYRWNSSRFGPMKASDLRYFKMGGFSFTFSFLQYVVGQNIFSFSDYVMVKPSFLGKMLLLYMKLWMTESSEVESQVVPAEISDQHELFLEWLSSLGNVELVEIL